MSLDRLEISLAITGEEKKARAVPVKNDPPRIVFSQSAAILIPIDGAPVWRPVQGTKLERVIKVLPGYPDNINRASDGTYWLALVGMRTPSMDLSLQIPGFRRRMTQRVSAQELLFPNINTGCVVKFDDSGRILESLWDPGGRNHPMITSMREHRGHLYLGGIYNDRVGRIPIAGADPNWNSLEAYWGART